MSYAWFELYTSQRHWQRYSEHHLTTFNAENNSRAPEIEIMLWYGQADKWYGYYFQPIETQCMKPS